MRQKPQARTVFQAGTSNWSKPVNLDMDSKKGLESQDEVVGVHKYTTRIHLSAMSNPMTKNTTNFQAVFLAFFCLI